MRGFAIVFGALAVSFIFSFAQAATYDATGRWSYEVHSHYNNCDEPPEADETGSAVLIQTGNSFSLVFEYSSLGDYKTVSGTIDNNVYTFTDRYWEEGGWTNETTSFSLSSASGGFGSGTWNWSGGGYSCSGGYSLSMSKQAQEPPVYNANGTWNYTETGIEEDCYDPEPSNAEGFFRIIQNNNRVTAVDDGGWNWKGFINGNTYTLVYSYPEDSGITTEVCRVELISASHGTGRCGWIWDEDGDSKNFCTGDSDMTIQKKRIYLPGIPLMLMEE